MRERIMKAFMEELQDKGIKFTMDDLARRLGISKRTLYEHFSSKAEVLDTIIEQTLEEGDAKTNEIIEDKSLSLMDKMKAVMTVLPNHFELYDIRILEQMKRVYPEQWVKIDKALKDDWDTLRILIEQGMEAGTIRKQNVAFIMKVILDAVNSTLDQRFFAQQNIALPEALEAIADVIMYGLVPRENESTEK
ncbi:TetR/AcrR family transcriptional regulator [Paenibacillus apiarius]|uniref:TetR/AcrR family transcriptional regulator n=1 Tax=Paenibacillus apiarius TaxID=46240 RepID=A0ABT4DPY4_9BACL|nr:TetR/AcrR family transcriptional regulator [Paenibacillus apiarius]MBN3524065.1 TetR/AcrR family transcriptional regulator [Paenibacillus apiarius]MCY9515441.1 TetR/AcrR family transcriptional regulator [Paenibacillus apiarius]MCY9518850.1 TetR/AcrR family transcriptional regulator [Paenibacillus apiarius]MCY9552103.1 TetR/AcrR family transcriptional regulator [Paenibacillus apiarius]MCY9557221.1 TetR/AcrR family transcriptional regulator [Paenibacillus apiarius]